MHDWLKVHGKLVAIDCASEFFHEFKGGTGSWILYRSIVADPKPIFLGVIHRNVGAAQQFDLIGTVCRVGRNTDGSSRMDNETVKSDRLPEHRKQVSSNLLRFSK